MISFVAKHEFRRADKTIALQLLVMLGLPRRSSDYKDDRINSPISARESKQLQNTSVVGIKLSYFFVVDRICNRTRIIIPKGVGIRSQFAC